MNRFVIERIDRIVKELKELTYSETVNIEQVRMKEGYYHTIEDVDRNPDPWILFNHDDRWGGSDKHAWFRAEFIVPVSMEGRKLVYRLETGRQGWDALNPQFLVFINQNLVQGYDVHHHETVLTNCAKIGERYIIDLQAYSGSVKSTSLCNHSVAVMHSDIEKLYYDIKVPLEVAKSLDRDDKNRLDIENHLETAINMLDLRKPYSKAFLGSVIDALNYLDNEFYGEYCGDVNITARCVGHTHIDVAWLWDLAQTRQKVQRSFATVNQLMKEYPEYIFMSSQPQLYQYLKEERPELYAEVKRRVAEGRWEAEGSMWLEADCNLTSGESLIRQIIHGKRFFREEFGVENKILWLPDVFGYSAALPQILKKSGIDYFMTTKISWSEYNKMPYDSFKWVGLDGSEVLTHFITTTSEENDPDSHMTTYNGYIDVPSVKGAWDRYQQKDLNNEVLISFGYGDGGGGPTKEMLETARRLNKGIPSCPKVEIGTALDFFEDLNKRISGHHKLPKWVGELYLEFHRGTLTSMARNKRYNRKAEFLFEEIEWLASMDTAMNGTPYPKQAIRQGWETILLNQFHDIIPGSSIKKVYDDSEEQYKALFTEGESLKNRAIRNIVSKVQVDTPSVMVFNPLSFERDEIVTYEVDGETKTFLAEGIPAKGYKVYPIEQMKAGDNDLVVTTKWLENRFFSIEFDDAANITSLYDKVQKREVIMEGQRGNVLQAFEDKPHANDAWDINIYYQEKMWEVNDLQSVEVVERGPHKATIEIRRNFLDSTITQRMSIYRHVPRVDFDTMVDWKEKHVLLKAAFPVDIHADKATYDIQFGNVERPTHWNTSWDMAMFEVCGHKWADLSECGYGVSLLNDCKYGYDIKDSIMRITLIKSATHPNVDADREVHRFTYSLYPHAGDWRQAGTVQMAYQLNCPVTAVALDRQTGSLFEAISFVSIDSDNVMMEVVKQAEDSDAIILRAHECYNKRTHARITFFKDIHKVYECDLEERQDLKEIVTDNGGFEVIIKPYEIKTFRLILK